MATENYARYPLDPDGSIRHWLTCGPVTTPILDTLNRVIQQDGSPFGDGRRWVLNYWAWSGASKKVKRRVYGALPSFTWLPDAPPTLHAEGIGGKRWQYKTAEEDQVIDFSLFNFAPTLMQGWTFALIEAPAAQTVQAELITIGPARLYVNGALVEHYADEFSYVEVQRIPVTLTLNAGLNEVYVQGDMLGWREARLAIGLRFLDAPALQICIPIGGIPAEQWHTAEDGLNNLLVKQFAFVNLPGHISLDDKAAAPFSFDAKIELPIPENVFAQLARVKRPQGSARLTLQPGERAELPILTEVTAGMSGMPGENSLGLTLSPADGTPLAIHREIWAGKNAFSRAPYGDYDSRRHEALEHLAAMPYDIPAAMAALELGKVERVSSEAVALACHFMENRYDCADFYAIGLLALLYRFPHALKPEDRQRIETAFQNFKYWIDEPGLDAMCYFTENHQILFHVAAYLAGQRAPEQVFANSGWTGRQQMNRARGRIERWILTRLRGNFSEWDSNAYMTLDAFAMLALVDYADSPRLRDMGTALLHKIFFLLACQSYRGVHGSTHGRCYVTGLKSARVENTSSLGRIAWGMGIFNGETRATGLLALARNYRVPEVIQRIGADVISTVYTESRSREQFRPQFDMRGDEWDVRTITYKSPDVMLSAAVQHRAGEFGIQEHLWQATLSPEASVFTTYPGNSQEHGNARPNFWAGSVRLPHVEMWGRTVMCLYHVDPQVGLGFTHAYFPTQAFDEWRILGQWAFARVGEGYVALWGDSDLRLTERGRHAYQELRSTGAGEAWISYVGRKAGLFPGGFDEFCRAILQAKQPVGDRDSLAWQDPAHEELTMTCRWQAVSTVHGEAYRYPEVHYRNLYTLTPMDADIMTITHDGEALTLDLRNGGVL
ncbi:MAG: hypothetical protein IPO91_22675 [Chloroflexi bacterium]|nr:hypothetical protein [Chloroflexota bacterium]